MIILRIYLLIINAVAFILMLSDKLRAKNNLWRIPERVLLGVAICGGSIGAIMGMRLFRHKTLHPQFSIGLPLIFAVQAVLALILFRH